MVSLWNERLAAGAHHIKSSAIRDLLRVTEQPEMISFAGGLPAPEYFPAEQLAAASAQVMAKTPGAALQYGPTEGYRPLRTWIAERMARMDMPTPVEHVLNGELFYEGERFPTLASLDIALHGNLRHVVYVSTFSKLLAPGLRVGWMLAPAELARRLVEAKQSLDLHTGSLTQAAIYETCRDDFLDDHIPRLRQVYRERRDALLCALDQCMPNGTHWTTPTGGMFLWVTLPDRLDAAELLKAALEEQVAFVPGTAFFANGGGAHTLRLNFTHTVTNRIEQGVTRLRRAIDTARLPDAPRGAV